MVEYGHLAGGAANSAAALKRAPPAAGLAKLKDGLGRGERAAHPFASLVAPGAAASESVPGRPLEVLQLQWGAEPAQPPAVEPETVAAAVSVAPAPADPLPPAGLERGMPIREVSKILGDPSVRTSGLAGRGYDEKALYRLPSGARVVVFAAGGVITDFVVSGGSEKTAPNEQNMLSAAPAVVP